MKRALLYSEAPPYVIACAILGLGALVHFARLADLPSPAGDETNWLELGLGLSRGEDASLTEDAQFVSRALGHLLALGFRIAGPSVFAGRMMPAIVMLITATIILYLCFERRTFALGLTSTALLLFHPWSLAWSRTVSVPYALSLSLMVLTPLAWARATEQQRTVPQFLALVAAMQLWPLSLHFSPLGAIAGIACILWTAMSERRRILWTPQFALAAGFAALHTYPLVAQALGARKLQSKQSTDFSQEKVDTYLNVLADYVSGESTIRHFTSARLYGADLESARFFTALWLGALLIYILFHLSFRRAALQHAVAGLSAVLGLGAITGLPAALLGSRPWWLPGISADRYGFVVVASLCLLCASAAQLGRWGRVIALSGVLAIVAVRTPTLLHAAWQGGSPDTGAKIENGGGWRGWRVTQSHLSTSNAVWRTLDTDPNLRPLTILAHGFGFQTLCFEASVRNDSAIQCKRAKDSWSSIPKDHYVALAVWREEAFAPEYSPRSVKQHNMYLRSRFVRQYKDLYRTEVFQQPDGRPLFELLIAKPR